MYFIIHFRVCNNNLLTYLLLTYDDVYAILIMFGDTKKTCESHKKKQISNNVTILTENMFFLKYDNENNPVNN